MHPSSHEFRQLHVDQVNWEESSGLRLLKSWISSKLFILLCFRLLSFFFFLFLENVFKKFTHIYNKRANSKIVNILLYNSYLYSLYILLPSTKPLFLFFKWNEPCSQFRNQSKSTISYSNEKKYIYSGIRNRLEVGDLRSN